MNLGPSLTEQIARARADLRMGVPIVLSSGAGGAVVLAAEALNAGRLEALREVGPLTLAITARRAETLKARAYDGDLARLSVPETAGPDWITSTADPATDLMAPMKGPFTSQRDGTADLHRAALNLVKTARLLPAAVLCDLADSEDFAREHGLTKLPLAYLAEELARLSPLHDIVSGRVPTAVSETGRVHVFRPDDGGDEHFAIEIGRVDRNKPALVRLHSACFTGDVLGSLKCDCGPQLHAALQAMGAKGSGVLLYLNQEGRGIGLANKMRAYALQDQGFDTVEANHRLGFEDDERDFRIGAAILREMGIHDVRLMTNNPAKVTMLEDCDVKVTERVPLRVGRNPLNTDYIDAKIAKSGHLP